MNRLRTFLSHFYRQDDFSSLNEEVVETNGAEAKHFTLKLGEAQVGKLRYGNGQWLFEYTASYHELVDRGEAKLVIGFPILDRAYVSPTLWPFFRIRLPGNYIKAELGRSEVTEVELLEKYGRRTVLNPYELAPEA